MDPPSYGRGSNGEVWKFEDNIYDLVKLCMQVLSDKPLFFLINSYTTGISAQVLENILRINFANYKGISAQVLENILRINFSNYNKGKDGIFTHGEIGLPMEKSKIILPCGIYGRYESQAKMGN